MEEKRGSIEASEVPHRRQWRAGKGRRKEGRKEGGKEGGREENSEGGRERGSEREHCTVGSGDPSFIFPLALLALLHLRRRTLLRFRTSAAFSSPSIAAIAALTICLGRAVGLGTCASTREATSVNVTRWRVGAEHTRGAAGSRQQAAAISLSHLGAAHRGNTRPKHASSSCLAPPPPPYRQAAGSHARKPWCLVFHLVKLSGSRV